MLACFTLMAMGLVLASCSEPIADRNDDRNTNDNGNGGNNGGGTTTTYTVTFNANGGSGNVPVPITVNAGSSTNLPNGNGLTRSSYVFSGWNTNDSGTGTDYSAGSSYTVNGNITLYAKWISNTGITLNVKQITDGAPIIANVTISRTNNGYPVTYSVSVNTSDYDSGSIRWEVSGVGAYAGQTVIGIGAFFILNAGEIKYNSLGGHALILTVKKNGIDYQRAIPFTIVP